MFDLRDKEHSTIIYESPQPDSPLLRLGWNKQDPRYMATIMMDCSKARAGRGGLRCPSFAAAPLLGRCAGFLRGQGSLAAVRSASRRALR